jgi:hypothetical protein
LPIYLPSAGTVPVVETAEGDQHAMRTQHTIPAIAFAALVAFSACRSDDARYDEPVVEEPIQAPIVEPAPVADPTFSDPDTVLPPAEDTARVDPPVMP